MIVLTGVRTTTRVVSQFQKQRPPLRKAQGEDPPSVEESSGVAPSEANRAWARLIKQVYEVDPLICPRCGGAMRILAFIEQREVIAKILMHLGLWPTHIHSPPAGVPGAVSPAPGLIAA